MRILGIVALCVALGGCASSSEDIMPAYVSPVAYQTYTCQQLALWSFDREKMRESSLRDRDRRGLELHSRRIIMVCRENHFNDLRTPEFRVTG